MGKPKALLPVAGTTLIEFVIERLRGGFADLLIAARRPGQVPPRLRSHLVRDAGGEGPLAGIVAGLRASRHETLVAVACDMPWLEPDLCRRLVLAARGHDAAVAIVGGRPEPAAAAYRKSALAAIEDALRAGRLKAAGVLGDLDVAYLELPSGPFRSVNTPAVYRELLAELEAARPQRH